MNKPIAAAILLLAVLGYPPSAQSAPDTISAGKSPGGIPFMLVNVPDTEWVSIRVAWPTEWAMLEERNQAVPYVGANVILTGGAEGYPPAAVVEEFADLEAEGNIVPGLEHVFGSLAVPIENLDRAVAVANAHLRAPSFDEAWVDRARSTFAAGLKEQMDGSWGQAFDALRWSMLGDGSVRRAMNPGPSERVQEVTREDLVSWHAATFRTCCALVVVAGPLDGERAGRAVDSLFAGLPRGIAERKLTQRADFTPRRILLHRPEATASLLAFLGQKPPAHLDVMAEDHVILDALNALEGPLLEAARTRLRAAYRFNAGYDNFGRANRFLFFVGEVEATKLSAAETAIREAYAAFLSAGPSDSYDARKARLMTELTETMKYPSDAAMIALRGALLEQGLPPMPNQELADTSRDQMMARLGQFPRAEELMVIAVSPDAKALPGACVIGTPEQAVNCK